jgi:MFS family permease
MHQTLDPARPQSTASEFRHGWTVVLAASIGVGAGITGVNTYSLGIFLNPLVDEFGWTRTEASASKTFLTLGYVLTAPLIGYLADRFGPRRLGMVSMVGVVLGMCGMTLMTGSIEIYYLFYFLLALLGCATTPLVWTRGVATWFLEKRGLALGLTLTGSGVAGIVAPWFIGGLIATYGWQAGYYGMAVLAAVGLIPIAMYFYENTATTGPATARPHIPRSGMDVLPALKSRWFWQISIAFAFIGGIVSAMVVHLVALLTDAVLPRESAVGYAGLLGFAVVAGRVGTGYLVDRFYPPLVAATFLFLPVLGCMILVGDGAAPAILIGFAAITIGLAAGSEVDLLPYLTARYFGLKAYGKIYGWIFVSFYAGVGIGPPFLGWMFDTNGNYDAALYIVMPILTLCAAAVALLGKAPEYK